MAMRYLMRRHAALIFLALAAGCTTSPTATNVAAFSEALTTTATQTRNGIAAVQASSQEAFRLQDFTTSQRGGITALRPGATDQQTLTALSQAGRMVEGMLNGLQAYAKGLAEVTSGANATNASNAAKAFGASVGALAGAAGVAVPAAVTQQGAEALGDLARVLVEQRLNRDIPPIIEAAHPRVEQAAEAIRRMVGRDGDRGLSQILAVAEARQRNLRTTIVSQMRRDRRVSDFELYNLHRQFWDATRANDDRAGFEALLAAVDAMVAAHDALRSPATAENAVRNFTEAANRLGPAFQRVARAIP